jgi:HK97 family phage prohead protease
MPTMTGHFAVWNQWTEIRSAYEGNFMERFSPQAMNKTLSESRPKVLFQHGKDPQIGDKVLGTPSRVQPDDTGAYYEVPLYDTSYNRDLIPGLRAGEYGASFRFSVMQEDVVSKPKRSETNPRGIPERTVTEAKVVEFGPVTFPAYSGASAGIRSITDEVLFSSFPRGHGASGGAVAVAWEVAGEAAQDLRVLHEGRAARTLRRANRFQSRAGAFRGHHSGRNTGH